jgi:hypothetical protein
MDFAVIVWNIVSGTKLHRFCEFLPFRVPQSRILGAQGGPILRFVVPPDNCNVSLRVFLTLNYKI